MPQKKMWKKVLYEDQGFPDNYIDTHTFLRDLKKNIDFKEVTYFEAIFGASLLVQELCSVVAFILVYIYLFNEWVTPSTVFYISNSLTFVGFVYYKGFVVKSWNIGHDLRTLLIYIVFGHLFSPVLHTLTDTISTDTIYTMTFFMLLVHLIFFDYGVSAAIVSNSVSLSAAVFASICLASRLSSAHHAFILITVAIEFFVLFPQIRSLVRNSALITVVLFMSDFYFLLLASDLGTIVFVTCLFFINFICPFLFIRYQKYKENIYGPWDEAVVDDADSLICS